MKVLAISSWNTACGIADYLAQAKPAIEAADPTIEIVPCPEGLDPAASRPTGYDLLWLNYHRGLHSRWTPSAVAAYREEFHKPVIITFHDTYGERDPDALQTNLYKVSQRFVVHEPVEGLPEAILIRQGVPAAQSPHQYSAWWPTEVHKTPTGTAIVREPPRDCFKQYVAQPLLGTVGFNFPWKNYDRLAEVTGSCGWALLICCNNATEEDENRWRTLNPWLQVVSGFQPTSTLVSYLTGCDATCFPYECANSGTSGAIRLGIAARKPVIAWANCRQFRDLVHAELNHLIYPIQWCRRFEDLPRHLAGLSIQRVDPAVAYFAHLDSWVNQGRRYADIFNRVVARG